MTLAGLQPWAIARLAAVPALAAFGAPLAYSPFADETTARETIAARLRTTGVVLEVGLADAQRTGDRVKRGVAATATFEVFVAESISLTHTPADRALVETVATALLRETDPYEPAAEFESVESAAAESGYILHVLTFSKNVTIPTT